MKELLPKQWGEIGIGDPHLPRNWDCTVCGEVFWPHAAHGNTRYKNHFEMEPPNDVKAAFEAHDCHINLAQHAAEVERHRKRKSR